MLRRNKVTLISVTLILLITLLHMSEVVDFAPFLAAAQEGNLVVNPGFEDDGTGVPDPAG
jgi:hypothetical protein